MAAYGDAATIAVAAQALRDRLMLGSSANVTDAPARA
jgi:hypothetical protein